MTKDYYSLTKSGLIYGNLITVIGGFALGAAVVAGKAAKTTATQAHIDFGLLLATIVGISLVMASGCVFNNYIDRDIDASMERTKGRALVTGRISGRAAIIFAATLGVTGFAVLAIFTNPMATLVALAGFFAYVVLYSLWAKRRTVHGTLVGAISGATPPVVGYAASSGRLDTGALILFAILILWQMPHFYAIAIRRRDDYATGKIPVLPVKSGIHAAKIAMLLYIIGFMIAVSLLTIFNYTGYAYLVIALALGIAWLGLCVKGFTTIKKVGDEARWARSMFLFSLIVLIVLFVTITIGALL